ncbi:MAG: hypothetical protein BEN19_05475 [Epulopiscium sp. Nuni2H_MBin003]|nr:MAG: hypothetical protein BEN19_05475 [Epulopiscium sp. Nuni2H_MBin003]
MKLLIILMSLIMSTVPVMAKVGTLGAKGAVLVEQESMRVLHGVNEYDKLPMASTTKIMTAIVALENGKLEDVVTVSATAAKAPPVDLKLQTGEKQRLGDLLYSLMLESHNDTAIAIAEHVGGSVEAFCDMMTQKAIDLGATNTKFETPNGLDGDQHYSTPYDLALITAYALENPKFIEIINTPNISIPTEPLEGSRRHDLQSKNRFLHMVEGANGVKTGYTSKAGHCFVGSAKQDDMTLIGVALGNFGSSAKSKKYTDVQKMIQHGFNNYKMYTLIDTDQVMENINVVDGRKEQVKLVSKEQVVMPLTSEEVDTVKFSITKPDELIAPVDKDLQAARLDVVLDTAVLQSVWLYPEQDVKELSLLEKVKKYLNSF